MRTFQILHQVDLMIQRAENGLIMANIGNLSQGMFDLVVYGRAVTNVLQKLRSIEPEFQTWYLQYRKELENDELMKFFYELRSMMLKEGVSPVLVNIGFEPFDIKSLQKKFPKPKNAIKMVISSQNAESYYEVKGIDGSIERIPIDFHLKTVIHQRFKDGPKIHLGADIKHLTAVQMGELFLKYLKHIVSEAHRKFDKMKV